MQKRLPAPDPVPDPEVSRPSIKADPPARQLRSKRAKDVREDVHLFDDAEEELGGPLTVRPFTSPGLAEVKLSRRERRQALHADRAGAEQDELSRVEQDYYDDSDDDRWEPVHGRNIIETLVHPWRGRWAGLALFLGTVSTLGGFATALAWGAPVLGHPADWKLLGIGVGGFVLGLGLLSRGWSEGPRWGRRMSAAVCLLLVSAFSLGVLTNPVVVDNRVFLSTSAEAKDYRLMVGIHNDLLRLRQLDTYLTYSPADAGAHYNEYAPALIELTDMSNKYAQLNESNLPDKRFLDTVAAMKSASYWASRSMQAKISLLDQDDAKYEENVTTFRTNFAEQYVAAGRALTFLSADLNIPFEQREHE